MTVTNRLSFSFLAALAAVLVGFSCTIFLLVRSQLHRQVDHHLFATVQALFASTEVFPDHVEWEPELRHLTIGEDPDEDQVRWTVTSADGIPIDHSANIDAKMEWPSATTGWRLLSRRIRAGSFDAEVEEAPRDWASKLIGLAQGSAALNRDHGYKGAGLVLTAGIPGRPIRAALWELGWSMCAISSVLWLAAAVWGRWLCRRALDPVFRMAASARTIQAKTSGTESLDVPATGDELEDLGQAFNQLLGTLRQSLERQQRFTGHASHQLRTPLTALQTSVEVTLRHERTPAEYQRVLAVVQRRSAQLVQIVETLLFLARSNSESLPPDTEQVELVAWINARLQGWLEHPRDADIRLHSEMKELTILIHAGLLGEAFDNLLDNACKFSDEGTPIIVGLEHVGNSAVISVCDSGCGINSTDKALVFEPFYQTAKSRKFSNSGVGLGLSIVGRIVKTFDGSVVVERNPERGVTFRMSFPIDSSISRPTTLAEAAS